MRTQRYMDQLILASKRRSEEKLERLNLDYLGNRADVLIRAEIRKQFARLGIEDSDGAS